MGKKKIEDQYKKLTDIYVILRPGMYIGSIKPHTTTKWIVDEGKMISKK
jgi:DNA gyrase/topoisomerase IV subunit B